MAITTYAELQTSIASWMHRTDLTAAIPDFITLAEARMSRDLTVKELDTSSTVATVANTATYALPADLAELRRITLTDSSGVITTLEPIDPSLTNYNDETGEPRYYSIETNVLTPSPIPDGVYTITYYYRRSIPALSVSNTTNAILTKFPELYLAASLVEAYDYTRDDGQVQKWFSRYSEALDSANKKNNVGRMAVLATDIHTSGLRGWVSNIFTG